jgi:hypothetical protein
MKLAIIIVTVTLIILYYFLTKNGKNIKANRTTSTKFTTQSTDIAVFPFPKDNVLTNEDCTLHLSPITNNITLNYICEKKVYLPRASGYTSFFISKANDIATGGYISFKKEPVKSNSCMIVVNDLIVSISTNISKSGYFKFNFLLNTCNLLCDLKIVCDTMEPDVVVDSIYLDYNLLTLDNKKVAAGLPLFLPLSTKLNKVDGACY